MKKLIVFMLALMLGLFCLASCDLGLGLGGGSGVVDPDDDITPPDEEVCEHTGGTATCASKAKCTRCGEYYGEYGTEHVKDTAWSYADGKHWHACKNGCAARFDEADCDGEATCSTKAKCSVCTGEHGSLDNTKHKISEEWTSLSGIHYHACEYGCSKQFDVQICTTTEATCDEASKCTVCNKVYGTALECQVSAEWSWGIDDEGQLYHYKSCLLGCENKHEVGVCTGNLPTCSAKGSCEGCGGAPIAPDNHKAAEALTADTNGTHYNACQYGCGEKLNVTECTYENGTCVVAGLCACGNEGVDVEGHVWSETPTAGENGTHYFECNNGCGETSGETACTFVGATCVTEGTCACGNVGLNSEGHSWSTVLVTGTNGTHYYTCNNGCGELGNEEPCVFVGATCATEGECVCGSIGFDLTNGHVWSTEWSFDEATGTHYKECANECGVKGEVGACTPTEATCVAPSVCSVCNYKHGEINENNHNKGDILFTDNEHYYICNNGCGNNVDVSAHTYGAWTVTLDASAFYYGEKTKTCICGHTVTEQTAKVSVLPVKGGANGIVVLMHDDGNIDTVIKLDNMWLKYGLVGDVAMQLGSEEANFNHIITYGDAANTEDDTFYGYAIARWRDVLKTNRWKLVSHSMTHQFWGDKDKVIENGDLIAYEVIKSQEILREKFPGQQVLTWAYPGFTAQKTAVGNTPEAIFDKVYSEAAREVIEETYISGRGGLGITINVLDSEGHWQQVRAGDAYSASSVWNYFPAYSLGDSNVDKAIAAVNAAATEGGLAIMYAHKVVDALTGGSNEMLTENMDKIAAAVGAAVADGTVWSAHYEDAIRYLREAQSASVSVLTDDNGNLLVTLTDGMEKDHIYNYPLSVTLTVPDAWEAVKIEQGGVVSYALTSVFEGEASFTAEIVPDGDVAFISPVDKDDVPAEEDEAAALTPDVLYRDYDFEDASQVEEIYVGGVSQVVSDSTTLTDANLIAEALASNSATYAEIDGRGVLHIHKGHLASSAGLAYANKYRYNYSFNVYGGLNTVKAGMARISFDFKFENITFIGANNRNIFKINFGGGNICTMLIGYDPNNGLYVGENYTDATAKRYGYTELEGWHNITYELYFGSDAKVVTYLDGKFAGETAGNVNTNATGAAMLEFTSQQRGLYDFYLDNISFQSWTPEEVESWSDNKNECAHNPIPDTWYTGEDNTHYLKCAWCGGASNVTACDFSAGDCTTEVKCSVCDNKGVNLDKHTSAVYVGDGNDMHWQSCSACGTEKFGEEKCTFSAATCSTKGKCIHCDNVGGDLDPNNHETVWMYDSNGNHWQQCDSCDDTTRTNEGTCAHVCGLRYCSCGYDFGYVKLHSFGEWTTNDAGKHTVTCTSCGASTAIASQSGKTTEEIVTGDNVPAGGDGTAIKVVKTASGSVYLFQGTTYQAPQSVIASFKIFIGDDVNGVADTGVDNGQMFVIEFGGPYIGVIKKKDGNLQFGDRLSGGDNSPVFSNTTVSTNAWHEITIKLHVNCCDEFLAEWYADGNLVHRSTRMSNPYGANVTQLRIWSVSDNGITYYLDSPNMLVGDDMLHAPKTGVSYDFEDGIDSVTAQDSNITIEHADDPVAENNKVLEVSKSKVSKSIYFNELANLSTSALIFSFNIYVDGDGTSDNQDIRINFNNSNAANPYNAVITKVADGLILTDRLSSENSRAYTKEIKEGLRLSLNAWHSITVKMHIDCCDTFLVEWYADGQFIGVSTRFAKEAGTETAPKKAVNSVRLWTPSTGENAHYYLDNVSFELGEAEVLDTHHNISSGAMGDGEHGIFCTDSDCNLSFACSGEHTCGLRYCSCGYDFGYVKLHSFGEWTTNDAGKHTVTCTSCGASTAIASQSGKTTEEIVTGDNVPAGGDGTAIKVVKTASGSVYLFQGTTYQAPQSVIASFKIFIGDDVNGVADTGVDNGQMFVIEFGGPYIGVIKKKDGNLQFGDRLSGGDNSPVFSNTTVSTNAWHEITIKLHVNCCDEFLAEWYADGNLVHRSTRMSNPYGANVTQLRIWSVSGNGITYYLDSPNMLVGDCLDHHHEFSELVSDENGKHYKECAGCSDKFFESACTVADEWSYGVDGDGNTYHYRACTDGCGYEADRAVCNYVGANCTTEGTCACGKSMTAPDSHNKATEWTTDEDGTHYHECLNGCGEKFDVEACVYVGATCTVEGTCECGGKGIDNSAHNLSTNWITENRQHYKICTNEGCSYKAELADCNLEGANCSSAVACDVCGVENILPEVHKAAEYFDFDEDKDTHFHPCEYGCGVKFEEEACDLLFATCMTPSYCSICNNHGTAANHKPTGVWVADSNNTHYQECAFGCGEKLNVTDCVFAGADCTNAKKCETCENVGVIPGNHEVDDECEANSDGKTHNAVCKHCGTVLGIQDCVFSNSNCTVAGKCDHCTNTLLIPDKHVIADDLVANPEKLAHNTVCALCNKSLGEDPCTFSNSNCSVAGKCDYCDNTSYIKDKHAESSTLTYDSATKSHYNACENGCDARFNENSCVPVSCVSDECAVGGESLGYTLPHDYQWTANESGVPTSGACTNGCGMTKAVSFANGKNTTAAEVITVDGNSVIHFTKTTSNGGTGSSLTVSNSSAVSGSTVKVSFDIFVNNAICAPRSDTSESGYPNSNIRALQFTLNYGASYVGDIMVSEAMSKTNEWALGDFQGSQMHTYADYEFGFGQWYRISYVFRASEGKLDVCVGEQLVQTVDITVKDIASISQIKFDTMWRGVYDVYLDNFAFEVVQ